MTPIEDIHPGQFICVVRDKRLDDQSHPQPPRFAMSYSGRPVEVIAISLPFIAVTNGRFTDSIDVRDFDVKVVTKEYAIAMLSRINDTPGVSRAKKIRKHRERQKRIAEAKFDSVMGIVHQPHERDCPRCGERMVRRRTYSQNCSAAIPNSLPTGGWMMVCKQCGFERPPEMAELR